VSLNTKEPYASDRQANIGIQYVLPIRTLGSLTPRLDANYQASFFTDITNNPLSHVGGRTLANARITWKSMSQDWETAVAVTNLTNHFYYINSAPAPSSVTEGQPGASGPFRRGARAWPAGRGREVGAYWPRLR
jgi:iron complex outermembrane receptor protein